MGVLTRLGAWMVLWGAATVVVLAAAGRLLGGSALLALVPLNLVLLAAVRPITGWINEGARESDPDGGESARPDGPRGGAAL